MLPMLRSATLAAALAAAAAPHAPAAAGGGDRIWRFHADFSVTVAEAVEDLSGNGGRDLLVGSQDDSLYLVEGRGPGQGAQLWSSPFRSTLMSAVSLGDVTGDHRADVAGGDELGFIQAVNGASGAALWKFLTFGAVLSMAALPDVNGDGTPDLAVGSENDTLYCFSGKASSLLGEVIWRFGAPVKKRGGGGDNGPPAKVSAGGPPKDGPVGVNSVALIRKGEEAHGVVAGESNDTVYCLPPAGGTPRWKAPLPGDAWKVAAFPDQDGDGIEEVLVACGADLALLLKGSNGAVLWSHAVSQGALAAVAAGDMTGDGKPDAVIGDGGGRIHCVPGNASGANAAAAWTYDFGDTSSVLSLAALRDVDGDGRADVAAGTSHDLAALISGKGTKLWSVNLGGMVPRVTNLGDLDGNGAEDVGAASEMGYADALQGNGTTGTALARPRPAAAPGSARHPRVRLGSRSGVDLRGWGAHGRRLGTEAP
jgi:hypothetical protein